MPQAGKLSLTIAPSTTDGVLLAAQPGGATIRGTGYALMAGATATTIQFNSKGSGAGTVIGGPYALPATGGITRPATVGGYFETKPGEGLTCTTGAGSNVDVELEYTIYPGNWGTVPTGPATKLDVWASTYAPVAGVPFTVRVTALDAGNQVVSGYAGTVKLTSTDTLAVLGPAMPLMNGVGVFTVVLKTAASKTVTATDTVTGSITGVTAAIVVAPAPGVVMAFSQQPTLVNHNASMSPAVTVTIKDSYGNVATNSPAYVTLSLSAGGTLTNGGATAAASGVATFSTLQIDNGGTYTLMATSYGLPSVVSSSFTVTTLSSLLATLVAYWAQEDTSDSTAGARTLTNTNGVTFVTGLVNKAASFTAASSMKETRASDSVLQMNGKDWTLAGWFKSTGVGAHGIFGKCTGISAGTEEYTVYRYTDGKIYGDVSDGASQGEIGSTAVPTANAWHFLAFQYDTVGNLLHLVIDNVAMTPVSSSVVIGAGSALFQIGYDGAAYMDGLIDEVGLWSSAPGAGGVLTATQLTNLYNAGAGATWPFTGIP